MTEKRWLKRIRNDATRVRNEVQKNFFSFVVWTNVKRKRVSDDETKKTAGRLPETTLYRKLTTPKNKMNFLIDNANQLENNRQNNHGKELITQNDN